MISVLMAVFDGERAHRLERALESLKNQTIAPSEIILVVDGPIRKELQEIVEKYSRELPMRVLPLRERGGLALALNAGISVSTQPWIMRFDSDDICERGRVEAQLNTIMSGTADVFGCQIAEFEEDPDLLTSVRSVPVHHTEIIKFALRRNPFNHMTVCFRKDLVERIGGYPLIPLMEDYGLWLQLISTGARTRNDPDCLVRVCAGPNMIARRGGLAYLRSEIQIQQMMVKLRLKPCYSAVSDGAQRGLIFLLPCSVRRFFYFRWLRSGIKTDTVIAEKLT